MITLKKNQEVTIAQLRSFKLERPTNARGYWKGIPHAELIQLICVIAAKEGWEIQQTKFTTNQRGTELAGVFTMHNDKVKSIEGVSMQLGLLTSNNLRCAMRLVAGATVHVCMNGMTTGDVLLRHRHTKDFNLEKELELGLHEFTAKMKGLGSAIQLLKKCKVSIINRDAILCDAGRRGIMPWSRLGEVDAEYMNPQFDYKAPKDSSWALLNAFTVVVKRNPPLQQMRQIEAFRQLLPGSEA